MEINIKLWKLVLIILKKKGIYSNLNTVFLIFNRLKKIKNEKNYNNSAHNALYCSGSKVQ